MTGAVVGLIPAELCADGESECNGFQSPIYRWAPVTLLGLGLTALLMAGVASTASDPATAAKQPAPPA